MATGKIKTTKATDSALDNGATGISQSGRVFKDPATGTCRIQFYARRSSDISTNDVLAVVPSGFRPKANYPLHGVLVAASGGLLAYSLTVFTNGEIKQSAGNSIRDVFAVGEYPYT